MQRIYIGIVGTGKFAMQHAKIWQSLDSVELLGVYGSNKKRSELFAKKYNCKAFSDFNKMSRECGLVDIVTMNNLHADYALKAIRSNCHVVIEKPLDIDLEKARQVDTEVKKNNVVAKVISNYRYNSNFRRMKQLLDSGKVGNIYKGRVTVIWPRSEEYYLSNNGWRSDRNKVGGGVLIHQCIHHIDLLHWFFGEVEVVNGNPTDFISNENGVGSGVERTFTGKLLFANGVEIDLFLTTMPNERLVEKIELYGDKGKIVANSGLCYISNLDKAYQLLKKIFKINSQKTNEHLRFQFVDAITSIQNKTYANNSIKNGLSSLETVNRLYNSKSNINININD
jgi:predicted dehydrogenase